MAGRVDQWPCPLKFAYIDLYDFFATLDHAWPLKNSFDKHPTKGNIFLFVLPFYPTTSKFCYNPRFDNNAQSEQLKCIVPEYCACGVMYNVHVHCIFYTYNVYCACRSLCVCVLCCAMHCVSVYYLDCSVSQSCPTTPCDYTTPIPAAFSFFPLACLILGTWMFCEFKMQAVNQVP